ncbi:hypothetical protein VNO78_19599 [Psophocarpus tetragonolobus]|uniref:Uncharacterized protein n=1 Tax=Psophocarpus tetragonolobus TaxID=3891 RepID=A0AAN9S8E1_PSOTE
MYLKKNSRSEKGYQIIQGVGRNTATLNITQAPTPPAVEGVGRNTATLNITQAPTPPAVEGAVLHPPPHLFPKSRKRKVNANGPCKISKYGSTLAKGSEGARDVPSTTGIEDDGAAMTTSQPQ